MPKRIMKILIISQYFFPENFRVNDFAFSLAKRGHEVTVLTGLPNYPKGKFFGEFNIFFKEDLNGISIFRVPLIPRGKGRGWQLAINYLSFLVSSLFFGPFLLRKTKVDIVFVTNYSPATVGIIGVIISRFKKATTFLWVQDLWPDSLKSTGTITSEFLLNLILKMVNWIYKHSNFILVQSKAFINPIVKLSIPKEKLIYFPNWAENLYSSLPVSEEIPERKLIPPNKFIVMFAGNLGTAQSLDTIVKAANLVREKPIRWIILGDGRNREWFESLISKFNLEDQINLLGSYPVSKMPNFFSLADVLLITLKKDPIFAATIPSKLQSYMLSGKAIVSSLDGEGARVVEESGSGLNVSAGNYQGLASIVEKMSLMTSSERKEMGQKGLSYYKSHFNREILISRFEELAKVSLEKKI